MEEELSKVDRLVSIDVAAKFEALQDEVDLLKNEVKQTLVDLREFLMKGRTIFPQLPVPSTKEASAPVVRQKHLAYAPVAPTGIPVNPSLTGAQAGGRNPDDLDIEMLSNFIAWLGSVKKMGLTLQQITPYLEAYEASGHLQPVLLKVILKSMADLDQLSESEPDRIFSPEEYATSIGQLHRIICASSYLPGEWMGTFDAKTADTQVAAPAEPGFALPGNGDIYGLSGNEESAGDERIDG